MASKKSSNGKKAGAAAKALSNSPLVMIWRRVSSLDRPQSFASGVTALKKVGGNEYANIYDAGTSLVAYWVQPSFERDQINKGNLGRVAAGGSCSKLNFDRFALVSNPGNELIFAPVKFRTSVDKLAKQLDLSPATNKTDFGENFTFVDEDGNFTSLRQPAKSALKGKAGERLNSFIARAAEGGSAAKPSGGVVGYSILVSDLKASQKFYKDVLGLRLLKGTKSEATFDVGTMIFSLKPEPAMGLVRSLSRAGRLTGDWVMFHVTDIKATVKELQKRGVKFPEGIEKSDHGLGAYFNDPDGHSLSLWQPPLRPLDIDYMPHINRILTSSL